MKKKILFIVQLPPPVHGTSVMNQKVVQNQLILSEFDCAVLPLHFSDSVNDIGTVSAKKILRLFIFCIRLSAKLISFRPHLVYFTIAPVGNAFYRDAFFSIIIKGIVRKRIFHLHGKGIAEEATSSSLKKKLYRHVFKNSHIIILARSLEPDILPVYNGAPIVLANGISMNFSVQSNQATEKPVFIYLSNLLSSKGIRIFLESLQQLDKKNLDFKAIITGAPADVTIEEVTRFIKENKLTEKVDITGPLYGKQKEDILAQANILVFPTYYKNEAFPLIILEAMQAGLAIISTNNGAIGEIIENGVTGFITPQKDVATTVEKMLVLAHDPLLRREMGNKAKKRVLQFYTMEIFERRLYEIFKQVLH